MKLLINTVMIILPALIIFLRLNGQPDFTAKNAVVLTILSLKVEKNSM